MLALALLVCIPVLMWMVQSALLRLHGRPLRLRIDSRDAPAALRVAGRLTTQFGLVAVMALYPVLRGQTLRGYYAGLFPFDGRLREFPHGAAAAILCLSFLYLAWLTAGRVEVKAHISRKKAVKRLALLIPTALFGATVEEVIFRGILMSDLLRNWAPHTAIILGALVFAVAHYVRSVKRRWTFPGHVALGLVLCLAFARTGNLWLSTGIHAGGIFMIMGTRPFFWYKGPAWLTGASIFPFAGIVGLAGLGVLGMFVQQFGGH